MTTDADNFEAQDYDAQSYDGQDDGGQDHNGQAYDAQAYAAQRYAQAIDGDAAVPSEPPQVVPMPPAAAPRSVMGRLLRIGLILLGIVIAIVILGVIGFSLVKGSHHQPLAVDVYPNTTIVSQNATAGSDHIVYQTNDAIDTVYDFYSRRLGSAADQGCKKLYSGTQKSGTPGYYAASDDPGQYYYRCVIDSSMLDAQQIAVLTIKPVFDASGATISGTQIDVSRVWGN